jgi:hypothetical protein
VTSRRVRVVWPDPKELCRDPSLAIVAALDATLNLAILSLAVNHPALSDCERPYYLPPLLPSEKAAEKLISIGRKLQHALADYRKTIAQENQIQRSAVADHDDSPF